MGSRVDGVEYAVPCSGWVQAAGNIWNWELRMWRCSSWVVVDRAVIKASVVRNRMPSPGLRSLSERETRFGQDRRN